MFRINRIRKFTGGSLEGIEVEESVTAKTIEEAKDKAMLFKCDYPIGGSPYEIIWSIITIDQEINMVKYFVVKSGDKYRIILTGVQNTKSWESCIVAAFDTYSEAELELFKRRVK